MVDSMPGGTFPQIKDSARILPHGSIRAAPDAPVCPLDLKANTIEWEEVETPIESRYLKAVALRLPPGFTPSWYSHPRDPDDDDPEEFADSSEHWGHLLGSWDSFGHSAPNVPPSGFAIWIGPDEGYPTSAVGGAEVRQVGFSECRVETALGFLPVALFEVQSPEPRIGGYYVVTYAQVQPAVYIQAMGTTPDSASQTLLLSSVATIRVVR
ncbi:MAG: hypothetical protein ACREL9_08085 [Gemmatimonadales bacterium]